MIKAKSSFPVFIVESLEATKTYYMQYFGFDRVFENEWYLHLVSESGIQIGFMLLNQPTQPDIFHLPYFGKGVIFSIEVDNVDNAYSQAQAQKLNIVLSLRSEDWGQRHFCVEDPNGLSLDVVQTIEATEEYQDNYAKE